MSGPKTTLFLPEIMQRRLTLTGSTLRPRSAAFKAMLTEEIGRTVWPFAESGELRPVLDRIYPMAEAAAAHARLEAGEHVGKIVLTTEAH
jgi:NADPH2:quinone reductase